MNKTIRVAQWGTGGVGKCSLRAIQQSEHLELVACKVYSPQKVGLDSGAICGTERTGVLATADPKEILNSGADVVSYNALWANVDDFCSILEAGINIVTTSAFVTGHSLGEANRARIQKAAEAGNSVIFGSGIHPGFSSYISLVAAGLSQNITMVRLTESVDCTGYSSAETMRSCGFGSLPTEPGLKARAESGMKVWCDSIYLAGQALGLDFDEVRFDVEFSVTEKSQDFGFMVIEAGCVAGLAGHWRGIKAGRSVVELNQRWKMGESVVPEIHLAQGYIVEVKGKPNISFTLEHSPPDSYAGKSPQELMEMNLITTAMPAINAIPHIMRAEAGIRTYVDLPLITGHGFVEI